MKKERLYDMDRLKGIAIFLVVLGHLIAKGVQPEGADWYMYLREYIYKFHMPLFMFTSGVVFFYTYEKNRPTNIESYLDYAVIKLHRLLPAYFAFGVLIFVGKILTSNIMHVDNVKYDFISDIADILIYPSRSAGGSLWYIYVLLQMYLLAPILLFLVKGKYYILLIISAVMHFIPITSYFMLDRLFEYLLYFVLGIIAVNSYTSYTAIVKRHWYLFIALFLLSFLVINYVQPEYSKLLIGLLSIPAIHSLVIVTPLKTSKSLLVLAKYTFAIYLMNTIAIGLAKGVLFKFIYWDGDNFIIFFIVLSLSGIFIPIFVKKYIFMHNKYINKMTN